MFYCMVPCSIVDTMDVSDGPSRTLTTALAEKGFALSISTQQQLSGSDVPDFFQSVIMTPQAGGEKFSRKPIMNDRTLDMFTWHQFNETGSNYQALDGQNPPIHQAGTNADASSLS